MYKPGRVPVSFLQTQNLVSFFLGGGEGGGGLSYFGVHIGRLHV